MMNTTLLKALVALALVSLLFAWSAVSFYREKTKWSFLQLLGAGFLGVVVITHICEALQLFPEMQWGRPDSVGHYLDFSSAILDIIGKSLSYRIYSHIRASIEASGESYGEHKRFLSPYPQILYVCFSKCL